MMSSPMFRFLDFVIRIPIIHDILFGIYRKQVVEKSENMGLPWTSIMTEQRNNLPVLQSMADSLKDPKVTIPDYYYAPIHTYSEGERRSIC